MKSDFCRLNTVLYLEGEPDRVPFYDLFADPEIIEAVTGRNLSSPNYEQEGATSGDRLLTLTFDQIRKASETGCYSDIVKALKHNFRIQTEFYFKLGYDYVVLINPSPFPRDNVILTNDTAPLRRYKRAWQDENRGVIENREDFEKYPWLDLDEIDFAYRLILDVMKRNLPDGMKIIPLTPGGVLENVMWLMGAVKFFKALYMDPSLIEDIFQKVGLIISHFCSLCSEDEDVGAVSMGDDMGYKVGPMIHPSLLRKYVFPWHKRCVENVHRRGKPFILHSCGNLKIIMRDLIEYVGIDAKHSYEDASYPVTEYKNCYGDEIAVLGGIDMDKLARMPRQQFEIYVKDVIRKCAPGGGYALGCGNTVANYVKLENYLSMLKIGKKYGKYPIKPA